MEVKKGFRMTTMMAVTAALALTVSAAAQPMGGGRERYPRGGPAEMHGGPPELGQLGGFIRLLRALDLTEEQREGIRGVLEEARDDIRAEMESTRSDDGRRRILELFVSQDLTEAELLEVMRDRDEVRERIRGIVAGALVDIHDLLTEEQLRRMAEMVEEGPSGDRLPEGPGGGMRRPR
jgi:Spy/CpxP family protein refolding chaperone